jgi:hypothetical protein
MPQYVTIVNKDVYGHATRACNLLQCEIERKKNRMGKNCMEILAFTKYKYIPSKQYPHIAVEYSLNH